MLRLLASFAAVLAVPSVQAADPVPRYKFEPGQEITYRTTSTFEDGERKSAGERGSRTDWTLWVVRSNEDGSFRLVIRQDEASYVFVDGEKKERAAQSRLVYADVFPDGRILPNDTIKFQGHPEPIFPRLPKDAAEAANGWAWQQDDGKITARPLQGKGFRFETVTESPLNVIYLSSSKSVYTMDQALISGVKTVNIPGHGIQGKWIDTTELLGVKATDPTLARQLATEHRRYFESVGAYDKALQTAVEAAPEDAKKQMEAAVSALKLVKVTHPMLKARLEERIKAHDQTVKFRIEEIGRRAKVVGRTAEAFETKDIDGKVVKLADLRGKVVVLDFWCRGCGWCVKAMPQMNGLAKDFVGKPVAIFGMNTDEKEEDARFVIEKMGLKYPTLKAAGLLEKFGVQGFPTLILIDQQGKVHDLHIGYTPTLREDVGRQIKALLEKK